MTDGRCPFAVWRGDDGMHGYPQGTTGQCDPLIFVDHIMAGWKGTLDGLWRLNAGVDVHFGIGRDGSVSQYTNILDAAWGNGVAGARFLGDTLGVDRYDRSNRHLKAIEDEGVWRKTERFVYLFGRGGSLVNIRSISFEHEGFPHDQPGFDATWPDAMIESTIKVKKWCLEELARLGKPMAVDDDLLVGHFQIDGVNRANCPGPEWPRARILAGLEDDMTPDEVRAIVRSMMVKDNPDFKNNVNHLIVERVAPVAKQADKNARTIAAEAVEAHEASHGTVAGIPDHKHGGVER